jgi:hypothetical protein
MLTIWIDSAGLAEKGAILHFVIDCKLTELLHFVENCVEALYVTVCENHSHSPFETICV